MKKIILLFALLISSIGFSQQVVVEDFEGSPDVAGFEGLGSATIKDDPATGGTNGKTLELVTATGGNPWQGATAVFADGILLDITTDKTIKVDVYSTTAFSLFAKVEGTGSPAAGNTQPHTGSGWETLTFSFTTGSDGTATANGDYSKISFFPNRNSDDSGWNSPVSSLTINIDNIKGFLKKVVVEDFEGSPDVAGFEGLGSATIKDDPATGGTNGKTLELVTATGGNPWQGATAVFADGILLDITTDKTIKVDVYSTTAFSLFAKVEGTGSPAAGNTQPHTGSGWETLTFSFTTGSDGTATANGDYSKISFFPNRNSDDSGWNSPVSSLTINIDNISGVKKAGAPPADPAPTDAPPTPPTRNASDVISLFSDAYTNVTIDEWGTSWDSADISDVTIAQNNIKKVNIGNFLGVSFTSNRLNLSNFTHFHIDIWTETATLDKSLNHKLSNHANEEAGETNAIEFSTTNASNPSLPNPNPGTWISYDIPLSDFTIAGGGKLDRESIGQYIISSNLGLVYFDNIYFYKASTASVDNNALLGFSMYPNPANNVLNISAKETIKNADIFNVLGKKVMSVNINKANGSIDVSNLSSGIYLIKYNVNDKVGTAKFIKQ